MRDVNLAIQAGKRVAFVGASGSGKSTVANLLFGCTIPSRGRSSSAERTRGALAQESLRAQFGVVPQESFLFDTSPKETLRYDQA